MYGKFCMGSVGNVQLDPDGIRAHDIFEKAALSRRLTTCKTHQVAMQFRWQPVEELRI
jgi:hypothetical protein